MHIATLTKDTTLSPHERQRTAAYKGEAFAKLCSRIYMAQKPHVQPHDARPQLRRESFSGAIYGMQRLSCDDHSDHYAPAGCMTAAITPVQTCVSEAVCERRGGHLICHHAQG